MNAGYFLNIFKCFILGIILPKKRENYLFKCECERCMTEINEPDVTSDEDDEELEEDDDDDYEDIDDDEEEDATKKSSKDEEMEN